MKWITKSKLKNEMDDSYLLSEIYSHEKLCFSQVLRHTLKNFKPVTLLLHAIYFFM